MTKEFDVRDTENTLAAVDDKPVLLKALKEGAELRCMLNRIFARDEDVVQVDEDVCEALGDAVHHPLEGLGRTFEAKRHAQKLPEAKRRDYGRFGDVHGGM